MGEDFDREMQRALELDGEKLRQLTGEDHGPFCRTCLGRGEVGWFDHAEGAWRNEPCPDCAAPLSLETCLVCEGTGVTVHRVAVYEAGCGFSRDDTDERKCEACDGFGTTVAEARAAITKAEKG